VSQVVRIPPARTLVSDYGPEYVPADGAQRLRNLLTDQTGRLTQRGRLISDVTWNASPTFITQQPWVLKRTDLTTTYVLWTGQVGSTYTVHAGTFTFGTPAYTGTQAMPAGVAQLSGAYAQLGNNVYGASFDTNQILRWDGTSVVAYTTGPSGGSSHIVDCVEFASRLFVLLQDGTLWYSDPGGPTSGAASEWQDDVSGLDNKIVVPDAGVALAQCGQSLAIFCNSSVHILSGSGSSNFTRRRALARGIAAPSVNQLNGGFVLPYGDGVYFVGRGDRHLRYFDGVQERIVSDGVGSLIGSTSRRLADVGNGYIMAYTGSDSVGNGQLLYHVPTGTWSNFYSAVIDRQKPFYAQRVEGVTATLGLDSTRMWTISDITDRSKVSGTDVGATIAPVESTWRTRALRLGNPVNKSVIRQVFVDFAWSSSSTVDDAWTITVRTAPLDQPSSGTVLATKTVKADGITGVRRRRAQVEVRKEAEDVWVEITANSALAATSVPELYDVWVEYDVAQQSRGY
jgi:hypothetical protein